MYKFLFETWPRFLDVIATLSYPSSYQVHRNLKSYTSRKDALRDLHPAITSCFVMVKLVSSSLFTFVHANSSLLDEELDRVLFLNKRLERFVEKFRNMVYKNGIR